MCLEKGMGFSRLGWQQELVAGGGSLKMRWLNSSSPLSARGVLRGSLEGL